MKKSFPSYGLKSNQYGSQAYTSNCKENLQLSF